jgi:hypothetical protein
MTKRFSAGWIIALTLVLAGAGCSDDDEKGGGDAPDGLKSRGDLDGDGVPNSEDDSDGDGVADSEDEDLDGDGIPNSSDDDEDGDGIRDSDEQSGGGSGPVPNASLPTFPGAGTSDAGDPLPGGMLCDSVAGPDIPIPPPKAECFYDKNDPNKTNVAATLEQVLECAEDTNTIHLRLTFHPWFVDNTYGVNSIGWPPRRGHRWTDLTKSDHAELILTNASGEIVLRFKLDYITEDASAPSGYSSLGVMGGDGSVLVGDASAIVKWSTSIDRNLNERGYDEYIPDSPATDEHFTANPDAPEWDFRVVYEAWVDLAAFGDAGFGGATIEYVHASPAKAQSDTIETEPGDCPPCPDNDPDKDCGNPPPPPPPPCVDNDPDTFCGEAGAPSAGSGGNGGGGSGGAGGDGEDPCQDNDPDTFCGEAGAPGGGEPTYCEEHPQDPACKVD